MTRTCGVMWLLSLLSLMACLSRLAERVDRALADEPEAVAVEADDGAPGVRQQDHVAHAEVEQDLRADPVVAQLAAAPGLALQAQPQRRREGVGRGLADQHD